MCRDATLFALESQEALLEVAWPQELLEHPDCKPVMVRLPKAGARLETFLGISMASDAEGQHEGQEEKVPSPSLLHRQRSELRVGSGASRIMSAMFGKCSGEEPEHAGAEPGEVEARKLRGSMPKSASIEALRNAHNSFVAKRDGSGGSKAMAWLGARWVLECVCLCVCVCLSVCVCVCVSSSLLMVHKWRHAGASLMVYV